MEAELLEQTHTISVNNNIIIIIIIYLLKKTTYSNRKASEQDRQDRQVKLRITTLNIQYCFLYVGFE